MSRLQIAAGNWKMNTTIDEGKALIDELKLAQIPNDVKVILGVPYTHLASLSDAVAKVDKIDIAAQNMHQEEKGAYTGEISVLMLKQIGIRYVIIGHSERRQYQKESDELLAEKVKLALAHGIIPIFCCGEELDIRKSGKQDAHVSEQIRKALFGLSADEISKVIIAYEPVWAIGTGETATPNQAQDMHDCIRNLLAAQYSEEVANKIPILYGGSVKPNNAQELFAKLDVDGGLVGGASLKAESFSTIINSF